MSGDSKTQELLAFAGELADAARGVILPYFRKGPAVEEKSSRGGFDPVTEADKNAEKAMRALIEARYPSHGVIGEEFGAKPSADGYTWYLDPIDGTRAFIAGLPLWGVLIGLCFEGKPIIGIIDQPYIGERFRGWPGGADFANARETRPLRVRECAGLSEATVSTTDPNLFSGAEASAFENIRKTARLARFGYDCYAYAMLADGGIDLVIENALAPWDVAALIPVVEGAGGSFTDWRGGEVWKNAWFSDPKGRGNVIAAGDARARDEAIAKLAS